MQGLARKSGSLAGLAGLFAFVAFAMPAFASGGGVAAQAESCPARPLYVDPSDAYGHGAVARGEWAHLRFSRGGAIQALSPPEGLVFEGPVQSPVLIGCDKGFYAVESSVSFGSRVIAFNGEGTLIATGDWIGQRNRWISLVEGGVVVGGEAGGVLAVDRPHLKGDLLYLRREGEHLRAQVIFRGVTNHRLGAAQTVGGARACAGPPSYVFALMDWSAVLRLEVTLRDDGRTATARETARFAGSSTEVFARAMACD